MRRRRVQGACIVAALALATPAAAGEVVEITSDETNVRSGAGTGNRVLGQVSRGQVYALLGRQGEWCRYQFTGGAGWSHTSLLRVTAGEVREVTASSLNVRAGPGTRFRELGALPRGARVAVVASSGEWRRIFFSGREAWVHGRYLGAPGATPPPDRPRSAAGFIELRASGPGFRSYAPASRRWGTPTMVYGIERIGGRWAREQPAAPRVLLGDISLRNGGDITGHVSHERGVDVDVRPMPSGSAELSVTRFSSKYSRTRTAALIRMFKAELPTTLTLFNDTSISGVQRWPNHDNHFHVRIRR